MYSSARKTLFVQCKTLDKFKSKLSHIYENVLKIYLSLKCFETVFFNLNASRDLKKRQILKENLI